MSLLDKPLISEEVKKIKTDRFNKKLAKKLAKINGAAPLRKIQKSYRFTKHIPKRLRKEWGERMAHLRSIR